MLMSVLSVSAVLGKDAPAKSVEQRIADLQAERIKTLGDVVKALERMYRTGVVDLQRLLAGRSELIEARLELATTKAERLALLKEHLDLAKRDEEVAQARLRDGSGSEVDYLQARATRLQREVSLLRENIGCNSGEGVDLGADIKAIRAENESLRAENEELRAESATLAEQETTQTGNQWLPVSRTNSLFKSDSFV